MSPSYTIETTIDEAMQDYRPLVAGKTILTTGVTPGSLGALFVEAAASGAPALLILVGRSAASLEKEAGAIAAKHPSVKTRSLVMDLTRLASAREAAAEVNNWADVPAIDVVVNSAGIMAVDYAVTEDGFEKHFAVNHLSHFLFTNLIMDKILASEAPRIVNITSNGHLLSDIRFADPSYKDGKNYHKWGAYGQSKTANMLFTVGLAEKLGKKGLISYSVHPGAVATTGLGTHLDLSENGDFVSFIERHQLLGNPEGWFEGFPFVPAEAAAASYAFAAFEPSITDKNGSYILEARVADPLTDQVKVSALSPIEAEKLWRLSEKMVGQKFDF